MRRPGEVGGAQIASGAEHRAQMQDRSPRQREQMLPSEIVLELQEELRVGS